MTPQINNKVPEGKQFRLLKYFSWASFIVLILFSFPFSMIISQQAKDILVKSYEKYALLIGQNLSHQVYQNFWIPTMLKYGKIKTSDKEQRDLLDRVVRYTIHGFKIDLVNIYSIKQGQIAYSTEPELIGDRVKPTHGYQKAVNGEYFSGLVSEGKDILGFEIGTIDQIKKVRTYIPLIGILSDGEKVVTNVFELTQDMTEEYKSIIKFQYLVFGLSILIMALIFLSLLLVVHKAERIIEQRAKEQRELEEQLNLSERLAALGEMVAGVSHEIKNPLGIIQSTADLLTTLPDINEVQKQLSGVIKEESSRLNRIVTEFLDFAKPQDLNIQECNLEGIIDKNLAFLDPEFKKKGIIVNKEFKHGPFKILADDDVLYRALLNIFLNSIHSIERAGTINVHVEREKDYFLVQIQDSGKGISEENLKKIFNPFFTTKDTGTGLGLAIVKKMIEGHKGSILIESIEYFGTKVTIRLPRRQ